MANLFHVYQCGFATQNVQHLLIGFIDMHTRQFAGRFDEDTIFINQIQCLQPIRLANHKVFHTVVRCRMHSASTCVGGYMVA